MNPRRLNRARSRTHRRGAILVVALWVTVVLVGLVLVMARQTRVESTASANRLAAVQAAMACRAGEQYVLSEIALGAGTGDYINLATAEAMPVGDAYFWIVRPDPQNEQLYDYGITDEGGKVDINAANRDMLLKLPGMTDELVDAIIDWRDTDSETSSYGAESDYYGSLPQPYQAKNAPFETIEELQLVKGMTPEVIWGYDTNHNAVLDDEEGGSSRASAISTSDSAFRGIAPFITIYGMEMGQDDAAADGGGATPPGGTTPGGTTPTPTTPTTPATPVTPTTPGSGGSGGATGGTTGATVNAAIDINAQNTQPLLDLLKNSLTSQRYSSVQQLLQTGRPFQNVIDFYYKMQLTTDEFSAIADRLTTTGKHSGLINVNTAPREVLQTLPGLDDNDAQTMISTRVSLGTPITGFGWVTQALSKEKAIGIGGAIVGTSNRYSADIVGVSRDGRAYRRIRVVVDNRQGTPKIVYRRDLTDVGWPLPLDIRDALRRGEEPTPGEVLARQ